ncbi:hypothetical protein SAMN04488112_106155 [Melghirimyces thermohalophilus]|uniref:Uncharacterized protein n=1 Tax=Melghirimyces thermohalophilus TaxID=1236220 RepID=A0A1G6KV41_9BACL|nr:hypothetical protein SAMN04488112_106155 [Melghirimyces thermohalophilus]
MRKEEADMSNPYGYYGYGQYYGSDLQRLLLFLLIVPVIFWFVGAL